VKPYTEIYGLENIVLEESYVMAIMAMPGELIFELDFVLATAHPLYKQPPVGVIGSFRRGKLCFQAVKSLQWSDQGAPPAEDATGKIDYGNIDSFEWRSGFYRLEGDWGFMEVAGSDVQVTIYEANSQP
jgi:hypothetical protein